MTRRARLTAVVIAVVVVSAAAAAGIWVATSPSTNRGGSSGVNDGRALLSLQALPLSFETNRGQAHPSARYLAHGSGFTLSLTPRAALFSLSARAPRREIGAVVSMRFVGAERGIVLSGRELLPGIVSYFIGADPDRWLTAIPTYASVRYEELYPGIDAVFRGAGGVPAYDFIVAPGADPARIALRFSGADGLRIDRGGNLVVDTAAGGLVHRAPEIFQVAGGTVHRVEGRYRLRGDTVGFAVEPYDRTLPLVIDPAVSLAYATYLGDQGSDSGRAIAVDADGNAYVTGFTASSGFPATPGAHDTTMAGSEDVFVAKLNASGSALTYATYLGGTGSETAFGIATDSSGNAYVTGETGSADFPTSVGAYDTSYNGGTTDAFVTKLNATGSALTYSTFVGGTGFEDGSGIGVDASGNAYVAGQTDGGGFPTTAGALDETFGGGNFDGIVFKLNPTGASLSYSTFLGGSSQDSAKDITVDASGNAYITGRVRSSDFPITPGAYDSTTNGSLDIFATKLDPSGALVYSTFIGAGTNEEGWGVAVDADGKAYLPGRTRSPDWPTTPGAFDETFNGGIKDVFVTKLDPTGGALVYSTLLGGTEIETGWGIDVDS
ncbi:MAG: SBBP repeat-containing protein, partial [Actinomycetota bacterium]